MTNKPLGGGGGSTGEIIVVKCNGERVSTTPPTPRSADLQQLAAAQREFLKAIVGLAKVHAEGNITHAGVKIILEEAVAAAEEISKALNTLAGLP